MQRWSEERRVFVVEMFFENNDPFCDRKLLGNP